MNADHVLERLTAATGLPAAFVRRVTELAPGSTLALDPLDWRGAVVVVRAGVVQVRLRSGVRQELSARAVLWLAGLDVIALHNPGHEVATLVSVRRRCDA